MGKNQKALPSVHLQAYEKYLQIKQGEISLDNFMSEEECRRKNELEKRLKIIEEKAIEHEIHDKNSINQIVGFFLEAAPYLEHSLLWNSVSDAFDWHHGQKRQNGNPFVSHPLKVGYMLAYNLKADTATVVTGNLHDVIDQQLSAIKKGFDRYNNEDDIARRLDNFLDIARLIESKDSLMYIIREDYGTDIYNSVLALSDDLKEKLSENSFEFKENALKEIVDYSRHDAAKRLYAVKVCDAAANMISVGSLTSTSVESKEERIRRKMEEAQTYILQMAREVDNIYRPRLSMNRYLNAILGKTSCYFPVEAKV